jgi:hypothetical protein
MRGRGGGAEVSVPWHVIRQQLAEALADLPAGAVVSLVDAANPVDGPYARISTGEDTLRCEISSFTALPEPLRPAPERERRIGALGWAPPDADRRYWLRTIGFPADSMELDELTLDTVEVLTRVFGFRDASTLRYSAQVERTGEPLLLAGLDIPYVGTPVPEAVPMAVQARGELRMRIARPVDRDRDRNGRPVVFDPPLDREEIGAVVAFLRGAPRVKSTTATGLDPFDPAAGAVVPSHVHTDGWWIWSEALAYYAWRYGIAPEPELLRHIRARGYRYPEVTRAALDRAAAMVRSPEHRPRARPGGPLRMDPERRRRLVELDRRQREWIERRRAKPPEA